MFIIKTQVKRTDKWYFFTDAYRELNIAFIRARILQFRYHNNDFTMYIYDKDTKKIMYNSNDYLLYNKD